MVDITSEINNIHDNQTRRAMQRIVEALLVDLIAVKADHAAMKTIFDAHTHNGDGSEVGAYYTSPPRSDAATVTAGVASAVAAATALTLTD